jgi:hypothetical protein
MKVIERSPIGGEGDQTSLGDRAKGIWQFGLSWDQDIQAQQVLIKDLGKSFGNSYTVISNVAIPDFSLPVPLVLVGPIGVRTFYVSAAKGIFRLKEDNWYMLDDKSQHYKLSRPNLVRRTELMSRAITDYLKLEGYYFEKKKAVLFFSQPGIHIDAPQSSVHMLFSDGVDRFAASLLQEETILDSSELRHITGILTKSKPAKPKKNDNLRSLKPPQELIGVGQFMFKPWQWIVIFVLAILMLIAIILTAYVLVNY